MKTHVQTRPGISVRLLALLLGLLLVVAGLVLQGRSVGGSLSLHRGLPVVAEG